MRKAILALADGTVFEGEAFGAPVEAAGEVVFNTSMTGYQEILTDPSYAGQIVCMSYPEMGNVGVNAADVESGRPHAVGMVVRQCSREPSNWRSEESLHAYLERHDVAGVAGIDTRRLVRHIRERGAQMGVLSFDGTSAKALIEKAQSLPGIEGRDLATERSCKEPYTWDKPVPNLLGDEWPAPLPPTHHVVAVDYGLKKSMLELLVSAGCRVTVVPAWSTAEQILALQPDGVFLTNGPGDPAAVQGAAGTVASLLGKVPMFGICLGHQIMGLAAGAKTFKLKFGHRGANQPVKDLATGKVEITSQNHGFAIDEATLKGARVTHVNLNDGTVEGIELPDAMAFSVQYHPEASPGPHDGQYLFKRFTDLMAKRR